MVFKDLLGMTAQDRKKKERAKAAGQIALGVGIAVIAAAAGVATGILIAPKSGKETREDMKNRASSFNDAIQRKAEAIKESAAHSAQAAGNAVKDVHAGAEIVRNGVKGGLHDVKQDIHHAAATISEDLGNR